MPMCGGDSDICTLHLEGILLLILVLFVISEICSEHFDVFVCYEQTNMTRTNQWTCADVARGVAFQ